MTGTTYTLITGASSGIGKALAWHCGSLGMNLLLISLPDEGLEQVALEIKDRYDVEAEFFETDLGKLDSANEIFQWTIRNKFSINILINNAGMAGTSIFESSDLKYNDDRILVNVRALVLLTRLFIPVLKEHKKSYILNIGSLSAFFAIPYKSVYSSSKAFVVNFSRAIRYELRNSPISISVVCPNGVRTNAGTNSRIDSHGYFGRLTTISPELIAKISIDGMLKGKFLIIPGLINQLLLVLQKIIPIGLQQKILVREFLKEVNTNPGSHL